MDKNNRILGQLLNEYGTSGESSTTLYAAVANGSTQYLNGLSIKINRSNVASYSVGNAGNFRSAIGAAASSDRRLKSNIIHKKKKATEFIEELQPVEYDINGKHEIGIIAQDVYEADKWNTKMAFETVEGIDGLDDWEKMPDGSPTWKLDYERIIPALVAALQQSNKKIEELESRIETLESKIN